MTHISRIVTSLLLSCMTLSATAGNFWSRFDKQASRPRLWGISAAYVTKSYHFDSGRQDIWGRDKIMNGIQFGIPVQPYFGYGLGLNTGIFYEHFFSTMDDIHFYEHNLNIPLMAEWRVPLGRELSVFVNGGISMDCGLRAEYVFPDNLFDAIGMKYGKDGMPKRVQFNGIAGGGVQWKAVQISAYGSFGITDATDHGGQQRKVNLRLSVLF